MCRRSLGQVLEQPLLARALSSMLSSLQPAGVPPDGRHGPAAVPRKASALCRLDLLLPLLLAQFIRRHQSYPFVSHIAVWLESEPAHTRTELAYFEHPRTS
jgi:hypothetical protein